MQGAPNQTFCLTPLEPILVPRNFAISISPTNVVSERYDSAWGGGYLTPFEGYWISRKKLSEQHPWEACGATRGSACGASRRSTCGATFWGNLPDDLAEQPP
jgi:hypothetical protein